MYVLRVLDAGLIISDRMAPGAAIIGASKSGLSIVASLHAPSLLKEGRRGAAMAIGTTNHTPFSDMTVGTGVHFNFIKRELPAIAPLLPLHPSPSIQHSL